MARLGVAVRAATVPVAAALVLPPPAAARAQTAEVTGHLHSVWIDARGPGAVARVAHYVTTDAGVTYRLEGADEFVARHGGMAAARGRRVRVRGALVTPSGVVGEQRNPERSQVRVSPILRADEIRPLDGQAAGPAGPGSVSAFRAAGSGATPKPYVTILCKFADSVAVEPRSKAAYEQMLLGNTYPAQPHFWQEVTGGHVSLAGSRVVGWYVLPRPKSYYFRAKADGTLDLGVAGTYVDRLQEDCVGAADPDVDYNQFTGINLQFNGWFDIAQGGGWYLVRDGTARMVGMTWMPRWVTPHTYAHEIGHSLGLPHSSTPYEASYGSQWDFMSSGAFHDRDAADWVPGGTISYHHARLGSLTPSQIAEAEAGRRRTVTVARVNAGGSSPQMLRLPLAANTYYTVEARRKAGSYDRWLPHAGVVIHRVDTSATPGQDWVPARVVDADNNRNPNDAGAVWTPGETWTDSLAGYSLTVLGETPDGYSVSVRRGFAAIASVRGAGRVTLGGTACATNPCEHIAELGGTTVTAGAVPSAGVTFLGWDGACAGTAPTCAVTLTRDRTITARFGRPVTIATAALREAVAGRPYADTLRADGGIDGITWELAGGSLPPGLSLSATTGVVAGTPTAVGPVALRVRARSDVLSAEADVRGAVVPPLVVAGDSARPGALRGAAFADTLRADAGLAPAWGVAAGTLPAGLTLDSAGVLRGTPTAVGTFTLTLAARAGSQRVERVVTWAVYDPSAAELVGHFAGRQPAAAGLLAALDRQGNRNGRLDVGDVAAWVDATRPPSAAAATVPSAAQRHGPP